MESIMSRFRRSMTLVTLLAVILFLPRLLVLGRAPSQDGSTSTGEAAATQKPDSNPVRVISFSLSDRPGAAGSSAEPQDSRVAIPTPGPFAAMTVIPQKRGIVQAKASQAEAKSTSRPVARAHHPFKWIAAKPMRSSARPQKQFISSGLLSYARYQDR
ncbi:MAG: hypothetical protein JOZ17_18070 [Acetobacteraceae bacterium]|nr:hypothetical protein [Acetobacteraceae bacterium]